MRALRRPYEMIYRFWLSIAASWHVEGGDPQMSEEKRRRTSEFYEKFAQWKRNVRESRHRMMDARDPDVEDCRGSEEGNARVSEKSSSGGFGKYSDRT